MRRARRSHCSPSEADRCSTLAGAGLRIEEALTLERRHLNLAKGTLAVVDSKTAAGIRVVDLTPALREELALWLDRSPFKRPSDLVFPTAKGRRDNRQNVRRRLLLPAVERANVKLASLGIEPIWRRHTRSPAAAPPKQKPRVSGASVRWAVLGSNQ
jgi:integrase